MSGLQKISRIFAAQRQLDAAIELWLGDGDSLAVHTLAMASYLLLSDLAASKDSSFREYSDSIIEKTVGHSNFRQLANQLKHADRDAGKEISVPSDSFNEAVLGAATVFYQVFVDDRSPLMAAFHLMMLMTHPKKFNIAEDSDPDIEAGAQIGANLMREDIALRRATVQINRALMRDGVRLNRIGLRRTHSQDLF